MMFRPRFWSVPALLLASLVLSGCASSTITARRTMSLTASHIADAPLEIKTRNGAVTVEVDPSLTMVQIEARMRCTGATHEEAKRRVDASTVTVNRDSRNEKLTIEPHLDGSWQSNDSCAIHVRMPGVEGVSIDTSNGAVTLRRTRGSAVVKTSNGRIGVSGHQGPLTLETSNGGVEVTEANAPVRVETSNGGVNVSLADGTAGPVQIVTSNGGVTLTIGRAFAGVLDVHTSNGRVSFMDAENDNHIRASGGSTMSIPFRQSGEPSSVRTSNGSVSVRRR